MRSLALLPACFPLVFAAALPALEPTPFPIPNAVAPSNPIITAAIAEQDLRRRLQEKRDLKSDLESLASEAESAAGSVLSSLGSNIPSYVASGIPNFFQDFPTGKNVESSLGVDSSQLSALPTQVLNIDPYANWTTKGWNVRFHGNVYKQPNTSVEDLNKLANGFLVGTSISQLPPSQQAQARNLTAEIYVVQQGNVNVSAIQLSPLPVQNGNGSTTGSPQQITLPYPTTPEGDFDVFVPIDSTDLIPGNATFAVQRMQTYVEGATLGNSTAYLVPETGLTIVNDIDDILRVTKIYEPKEGLLNSFARPFTAWQNMPEIYANLQKTIPNLHFHYLTTTPEQITRNYMQYIYSNYPLGSFDTRPLNFSNVEETLKVRKALLDKIFQTFPYRKFILVADTSNSDVMTDYPQMVTDYPGQVQCIWLRNTSATDPGDKFPYDTSGFKNVNQSQYMFFVNADDLTGLDVANGECWNKTIKQNVTFGWQGLPFGLSSGAQSSMSTNTGLAVFALLGVMLFQLL